MSSKYVSNERTRNARLSLVSNMGSSIMALTLILIGSTLMNQACIFSVEHASSLSAQVGGEVSTHNMEFFFCGSSVLGYKWSESRVNVELTANPRCSRKSSQMLEWKSDKTFTFLIIYYNHLGLLALQIDSWLKYSSEVRGQVHFLIVDDCSRPGFRAADLMELHRDKISSSISLEIYEIEQDLVWNIGGARNLGFHASPTEWVFLNDVDILVPQNTMEYLLYLTKASSPEERGRVIYTSFDRLRADGITRKTHPALIMTTKSVYWQVGGCDEDFVGHYGFTDGHFFWRAARTKDVVMKQQVTKMGNSSVDPVRELSPNDAFCPWETCPTPLTPGLNVSRDSSFNAAVFNSKINGSMAWAIDYLRYTWHKVVTN